MQAVPIQIGEIYQRLQERGIRSEVCGKIRRGGWLNIKSGIIVAQSITEEIHEALAEWGPVTQPSIPNTTLVVLDDFPIYVYATTEESWGAALIFYTGHHRFKWCLCADAKFQGLKLSVTGLWQGKNRIAGRDEKQIFDVLGVEYRHPQQRQYYRTKRREARLIMKENAVEERKDIYRAVIKIFSERRRGTLPVKRSEIVKAMDRWLDETTLMTHILWLRRHGVLTQVPGGWLANALPEEGICWIHGKRLPCFVCRRKKERIEARELARLNRESRKGVNNVVQGTRGI